MNIPVEIACVGDSIMFPLQHQLAPAVIQIIKPGLNSFELVALCLGEEVKISIPRGHTIDLTC